MCVCALILKVVKMNWERKEKYWGEKKKEEKLHSLYYYMNIQQREMMNESIANVKKEKIKIIIYKCII